MGKYTWILTKLAKILIVCFAIIIKFTETTTPVEIDIDPHPILKVASKQSHSKDPKPSNSLILPKIDSKTSYSSENFNTVKPRVSLYSINFCSISQPKGLSKRFYIPSQNF